MSSAVRQLRYVLRSLAQAPLFTTVAVLTLALGIGATTAVFSVVYGVLLKPLPFPHPDRLVGVWHRAPGMGWDQVNQSPALYFTYRDESRTFEDSGMWANDSASVTGLAEPEEVPVIDVTDGTLSLLGARPLFGRLFNREDDSPGSPETVLLTYAYWQKRFGGDPKAVGKTLTVDGRPHEIIGVLPADLHFLDYDPSLFLPMRFDRSKVFFGNFSYQGLARLRPGVTLEQADADVARMIPIALENFPLPPGFSKEMVGQIRFGPALHPLKQDAVGDVGNVLWVLLGTVGIVLLVASANVANLFLVRSEARRQQLAIRSALGADRGRIGRELLAESAVLGLAGGAAGLGLAYGGLRLLAALAPEGLPRLAEIGLDPPVLLFTLLVSLLSAAVFGSLPVVRLRTAELVGALKEEGRSGSGSRERNRARNLLVTAQIALALVLMIGSGLMVRSFRALENVHPGFVDADRVQTFRLSIPEAGVKDPEAVARLHETLLDKLETLPGITSAAVSSSVTLDGRSSNDPIFVEDFPPASDQIPPLRRYKWISPGYFATMGNPVVAGRDFTWDDVHQMRKVVVVTEAFAREVWGDPAAAVGRRIRNSPDAPWREIVGVVGDVRDDGLTKKATAVVYWPLLVSDFWTEKVYAPRSLAYVLRSPRVGTPGFLDEVRNAVWSVDPDLPLARVQTLGEILAHAMARTSFTLVMLAIAAMTALLLGGIGIYGVTSYTVAQRSREIGVRMALGARRRDVARLVLRQGLVLAAVGVGVGLVAALGLTRLMAALLYGVGPVDVATYAAGGLGTALLALFACWVPARRAAAVNPLETLH